MLILELRPEIAHALELGGAAAFVNDLVARCGEGAMAFYDGLGRKCSSQQEDDEGEVDLHPANLPCTRDPARIFVLVCGVILKM